MASSSSSSNSTSSYQQIFNCFYKGIELSCVVGDILNARTTGIGILCDSRFSLNSGIGRTIKNANGGEFAANLRTARREQNSLAISVQVESGLHDYCYVILMPVRGADRGALQLAYISIIEKAKENNINSLTIPLLGTGQLGLPSSTATAFLKSALQSINTFGNLQKLQFIDRNENLMFLLRDFLLSESGLNLQVSSINVSDNPSMNSIENLIRSVSQTQDGRYRFQITGSGTADSPVMMLNFPATSQASNSSVTISTATQPSVVNSESSDDDSNETESMDEHSEQEDSSDDDSDDLADSDLEDSSDEDFSGMSTDSVEDEHNHTMDSNNENENISEGELLEEKRFWTLVPMEKLIRHSDEGNSSLGPSSARDAASNTNLDESTLPCSICLTDMREEGQDGEGGVVIALTLCSHQFHRNCIRSAFKVKKQCPLCMCWYGSPIGYQPPNATMTVSLVPGKVPGFSDAKGFYEITYRVPAGVQGEGHIRPGLPYRSCDRKAYLPNNAEGVKALKMLQLAFKRRLIFTIGDSLTSGRRNVPIWNIHHKTNKDGGAPNHGYPDSEYLHRLKEELAMVGVREDQLT